LEEAVDEDLGEIGEEVHAATRGLVENARGELHILQRKDPIPLSVFLEMKLQGQKGGG